MTTLVRTVPGATTSRELLYPSATKTPDESRAGSRALLEQGAAFRSLPVEQQERLVEDTARLVNFLHSPTTSTQPSAVLASALALDEVNFPEFVASLIDGVFQAMVTASIQQMKAYAELLAEVAQGLEAFAPDPGVYPCDESAAQFPPCPPRRHLTRAQQRSMAARVQDGIGRISTERPNEQTCEACSFGAK